MTSVKQQRRPRFRRVSTINLTLQERDAHIIYHVYRHRFLTSQHITALLNGSRQGILRRLKLLFHGGYLDRPLEQIRPNRLGSEPLVYGLGNKGADLLVRKYGIPRSKVDWTTKNREVGSIHLDHALMVAHFMVCLELACRRVENLEFIDPSQILASVPIENQYHSNSLGWKVKASVDIYGKRNITIGVVPDKVFGLYFREDKPGRNRTLFFLEVDRSTMPIKRNNPYRSSYFKKLTGYWESWRQGLYAQIFGFKAVRILTVAKSQERINSMVQVCRELDPREIGLRMFLFVQAKEFSVYNPERVLESIWRNSRDERLISLVD